MVWIILIGAYFITKLLFIKDNNYEVISHDFRGIKYNWSAGLIKQTIMYAGLSSSIFIFYMSLFWYDYIFVILLLLTSLIINFININIKINRRKIRLIVNITNHLLSGVIVLIIGLLVQNRFLKIEREINLDYILLINYVIILILLSFVANTLFKILFKKFKPQKAEGSPNAGALIGTMERILLIIMFVTNNWAGVGLIIAAKSVARFDKMKEEQFGEYFMIGTLFSIIFTAIVYYVFFEILLI